MDIENREIDRLARELAAETGETLTEAVKTALRERLERADPASQRRKQASTAAAII